MQASLAHYSMVAWERQERSLTHQAMTPRAAPQSGREETGLTRIWERYELAEEVEARVPGIWLS